LDFHTNGKKKGKDQDVDKGKGTTLVVILVVEFLEKCCSGYKHPPNFFLSFILEPPYQPSSATCIASSST